MWGVFRALIDHINSSPWKEAVFAYQVAYGSTEECTYQEEDYSPCNLTRYQDWLLEKYGSFKELQQAWCYTGTALNSISDVRFPPSYSYFNSLGGALLRDENGKSSNEPALLIKNCGTYRSAYSLLPTLPAQALQELCLLNGVFSYTESAGDYVYAGGNLMGLYTPKGGHKRLNFPISVRKVTDAYTGEVLPDGEFFVDMICKPGETRLFYAE